jgi:hypothetical protein
MGYGRLSVALARPVMLICATADVYQGSSLRTFDVMAGLRLRRLTFSSRGFFAFMQARPFAQR